MKKCTENKYPSVTAGDVVKNSDTGGYYLACYATYVDGARLVNLETGHYWSHTSTWDGSDPKEWTKVDVCFEEIK